MLASHVGFGNELCRLSLYTTSIHDVMNLIHIHTHTWHILVHCMLSHQVSVDGEGNGDGGGACCAAGPTSSTSTVNKPG